MTTRKPPVIPEIAKAYQNDPRTRLALQAMADGTSNAPVAQGQYAYADGIARALQAAMGGYVDRKQQERYGSDQDKLLALRAARGADGLTGVAPPSPTPAAVAAPTAPQAAPQTPPSAPQATPANAAAVASALGAPAPQPATPGLPPIPQAPATGGGPVGRVPFSLASSVDNTPPKLQPGQQVVPNAPAPVARPVAPDAIAPTRSKLLDAAYRIMTDADPYESAQGQEMYSSGLSDQTKLDEAAAERQQKLRDMGYESDLSAFNTAQSQDRSAAYDERGRIQTENFTAGENTRQRTFDAEQNDKNRALQSWQTRYGRQTQMMVQNSSQAFEHSEGAVRHGYDMELQGLKNNAEKKVAARAYLTTATGQKQYAAAAGMVDAASQKVALLDRFAKLNSQQKTGGVVLGNAPGLVKWSNSRLQMLDGITQALVATNAKMLPGALSDKEGARLEAAGPSIRKTGAANKSDIDFLRGAAVRQRDFARYQMRAMENGEGVNFLDRWTAYTNSVPVTSNQTYDQWAASVTKVDRNGNPVKR